MNFFSNRINYFLFYFKKLEKFINYQAIKINGFFNTFNYNKNKTFYYFFFRSLYYFSFFRLINKFFFFSMADIYFY
jgi:hypothetical protein